MALDGVTISNVIYELKEKLQGGRIDKIYQPEKDEIIMNIRSLGNNLKLLLTANSSQPRIHLTEQTKNNPMQAPLFCMVMRKHLTGGKIIDFIQPNFERIVEIHIEAVNELGDLCLKKIIIEIMGKHSNIIIVDENNIILDSVKRISHDTSSVREVLPGKLYVLPPSQNKLNILELTEESFYSALQEKNNEKIQDALYKSYSGVSPFLAGEICFRAGVEPNINVSLLNNELKTELYYTFRDLENYIKNCKYSCEIIFSGKKPIDFSSVTMTSLAEYNKKNFESISNMLEFFYGEKDIIYRTNQKTTDIKKVIQINLERRFKKKELYIKTFNDIKNRDKLKIKGEIITANIHSIEKGMTSFTTENFYVEDCPLITITLDPNLTPSENAQSYFKKYNKQKRTFVALQEQVKQNDEEITYLESLLNTLNTPLDEADIEEIREELAEEGFIKKRKKQKGLKPKKAKPLQFISSDGFEIYVGKNNKQNDELTLRFAEALDIWLHTKDIPGSHVIIKAKGKSVPNTTLNEAAHLAVYYSKGKESTHVPVDYTTKRNVKKPNGAKPGMVIYDNYNTAYINPDDDIIKSIKNLNS